MFWKMKAKKIVWDHDEKRDIFNIKIKQKVKSDLRNSLLSVRRKGRVKLDKRKGRNKMWKKPAREDSPDPWTFSGESSSEVGMEISDGYDSDGMKEEEKTSALQSENEEYEDKDWLKRIQIMTEKMSIEGDKQERETTVVTECVRKEKEEEDVKQKRNKINTHA